MRRLESIILLIVVLVFLAWPSRAQEDPCQYAHVVDPCEKRVVILPVGSSEGAYQVHFDEGPAAAYEPRGVALATVPGAGPFTAFVTQGSYVHIVDYSRSEDDGTITDVRSLDLDTELSLPPLQLTGLYAADPIVFNDETYYFLYIVGTEPGPPRTPWLVIFEQEGLLSGTAPFHGLFYAGQIGTEEGRGIDIAAGASLAGGTEQVAYASVLSDINYEAVQRFYKITFTPSQGFEISLDSWNDEGIPFTGSEPAAIGLDHESLGIEAYGAFQTSSVISKLSDGTASCDLAGDPTDVAVWGPDSSGGYVHFATVADGGAPGTLLGYTEGVCPYESYVPPRATPGALKLALSPRPMSLDLTSDTDGSPWIYTANASGDVQALQVSIVEDQAGDLIEPLDQFIVETEGCPYVVVVRDPAYWQCVNGLMGDPKPPPSDPDDDECESTKYCKQNPTDPQCLLQACIKGTAE